MVSCDYLCLWFFFASVEGFRRWLKHIQPIYDEILELQREKLRLEVSSLKTSTQPNDDKLTELKN